MCFLLCLRGGPPSTVFVQQVSERYWGGGPPIFLNSHLQAWVFEVRGSSWVVPLYSMILLPQPAIIQACMLEISFTIPVCNHRRNQFGLSGLAIMYLALS